MYICFEAASQDFPTSHFQIFLWMKSSAFQSPRRGRTEERNSTWTVRTTVKSPGHLLPSPPLLVHPKLTGWWDNNLRPHPHDLHYGLLHRMKLHGQLCICTHTNAHIHMHTHILCSLSLLVRGIDEHTCTCNEPMYFQSYSLQTYWVPACFSKCLWPPLLRGRDFQSVHVLFMQNVLMYVEVSLLAFVAWLPALHSGWTVWLPEDRSDLGGRLSPFSK